jgi:membrane protein DedA with SNARE-associated domain
MIPDAWQQLAGLFFGTFVSEDAACAAGGLLASQGSLSLTAAVLACGLGIFASDLALVFAGRALARGSESRWLRWLLPTETKLAYARRWFDRRGLWVVLASRFLPGTRCATCVTAGVLRVPLGKFLLVFLAASAVWTPLAVGAIYATGEALAISWSGAGWQLAGWGAAALLAFILVTRLVAALFTHRGRRLLGARWHRLTHFEFWPWWIFYGPVLAYILARLATRHRSFGIFTAANPAMPGGGICGESKSAILGGLGDNGGRVAAWTLLSPQRDAMSRLAELESWLGEKDLRWPVVLKPDVGERGTGVSIVRDASAARHYLAAMPAEPVIAQTYVGGKEFGIFYARRPGEACGKILSITGKHLPSVTGDGERTLEELILDDDRAVLMADFFFAKFKNQLADIPPHGTVVPLADIGNHCRGAVFLDFTWALTPELEQAIEELAQPFAGFHLGRFDLRAPSLAELRAGRGLKVLELNGVTSEQGHIYDPNHLNVWRAWGVMFAQWRLAFEIGAENVRRGATAYTTRELVRLLRSGKIPAVAVSPAATRNETVAPTPAP